MAREPKPYDLRNHIEGLEKGLAVIRCFDREHHKLTIAEVAQMVGLSRAAARRCLLTLTHLGYAEYDGKFFRLTVHVMRLGYAYLASTTTPQILQTQVERLCEQTKEACSASILDGEEMVYVARAAVKRILSYSINVGSRLPAFCTSMGRVLLAGLDPAEAEKRLAASARPKFTKNTITKVPDLLKTLAKVRADGFSLVEDELEIGLLSLSVPIFDSSGNVVAAVAVTSQPHRVTSKQMLQKFLPKLNNVQNSLSAMI